MADLWIYEIIGEDWMGGVTARGVRDELAKMGKNERVNVRINSPGGDVFEAVAINSLLAERSGGVDVTVDGLAASAASYVATMGENVTMAEGSMFMVHDPWTVVIGNAAEMTRAAEMLDKVADNLVGAYARKSGLDRDEVRDIMRAETWLTADEAVGMGFANSVSDMEFKACAVPKDLGYKRTPKGFEQTARIVRFKPGSTTTDGTIEIPEAVSRARSLDPLRARGVMRLDDEMARAKQLGVSWADK